MNYDPRPEPQRPVPLMVTFVACIAAGFMLAIGVVDSLHGLM